MNDKLEQLRHTLRAMESVIVAYSGGVDSTLLLKIAHDELGDAALAVTADSPSLPREDFYLAREIATSIGARHLCVPLGEMSDPRYLDNPPDRCYFCKTHTYAALIALARRDGFRIVVDGTNADDAQDVRPGRLAAQEHGVRSPLLDAGLTKTEIRELARDQGLPNWNKPAAACLSSRIPYGTRITLESLSRVERAEQYLRTLGLGQVRVRHLGMDARVEVEPGALAQVRAQRQAVVAQLNTLGFDRVALNLDGYRTGSLNRSASPRVEWL